MLRTRRLATLCTLSFLLVAALSIGAGCRTQPTADVERPSGPIDVWIDGGTVVDGSGGEAQLDTDVLIQGHRVVFVGQIAEPWFEAETHIDATGKIVAPGFIDAHAHGDPLRNAHFRNALAMGVTTLCLGMDGSSPTQHELGPWLDALARRPLGPNIATFVGHGTARARAGLPMERDLAEPAQLRKLTEQIAHDLDAGAIGLSTGLEYTPGRFAGPHELTAAALPVAARNRLISSHVRSEDAADIQASVEELFAQCQSASAREGACAAHISHLKVVYGKGPAVAESLLATLERGRRDGLRVTADIYPYIASYTGAGIVFPDWAHPPADFDDIRESRRSELATFLREKVHARNGPSAMVFGNGRFAGQSLEDVATTLGKRFEEVLIDDIGPSGTSAAHFVMEATLMRRLLTDPHVMIASDGSPTMRHPRGHGTFAKVLAEFVREEPLLTIEEAVRKMTSLPATTLGMPDRGHLRRGSVADVVVLDLEAVDDHATFAEPFQLATGFEQVLVGGEFAIRNSAFTATRSGQILRADG